MSLLALGRHAARHARLAILAWTALALFGAGSVSAQTPASIPLGEALALAAERTPLVRAARARQQAALGARAAVPALPNPFVELRGENFGPHSTALLTRDVFATVSQPLELGGKRAARVASADAVVAMADAERRVSEWTLAFEVASFYLDALRARELLASLTQQREGLAELVATLSQRVQAGLTAEADWRKLQTEHQRLVRQVSRTEITARAAILRLSAIVGIDVRLDQLVPVPLPVTPLPAIADPARLAKRPDVGAARARVARAEAALGVERARGVPDVTLTTGYKRTGGLDTAVAGITMPIALFDRNRVATALAGGEIAAARFELERVQQLAYAEAQAYLDAAARLTIEAASARQDLLEPATVVRVAARSSYTEGRGDVLQLVDAERVFAEASREVIELQLDALAAHINARLSLGESPLP